MAHMMFLTETEWEKARAAFEISDADGSGSIDIWELRDTLHRLGQDPTLEEVVEMVAAVDKEEKGVIDFEGFVQLLGSQKVLLGKTKERDDSETLDAFVALGGNEDKTGVVKKEKLRDYIDMFGLPILVDKLIGEMIPDGTGHVDYEQFKAMMLPEPIEVVQNETNGSVSPDSALNRSKSTPLLRLPSAAYLMPGQTAQGDDLSRSAKLSYQGNGDERLKVWESVSARKQQKH
eukprot:comp12462_c0_seq1/m.16342 comp12462_c0_seq1/g.16342  ORF comp12462_c0_seq1/g.16342 comp12462_c0_seq1/m.16342 type:complete len:233 (-) comp12462_c0_seq1:554-1252(-)